MRVLRGCISIKIFIKKLKILLDKQSFIWYIISVKKITTHHAKERKKHHE
jgi:hypothetical protein